MHIICLDALRSANEEIKKDKEDNTTNKMPKPPVETPGERAMKQYESIDVTDSTIVSIDDEDENEDGLTVGDDDNIIDAKDDENEDSIGMIEDEEALLLEAQREAAEAEQMLREAEEEAAKWEKELAEIEEAAAAAELEAAQATAQAEEATRLASEMEAAAAAASESTLNSMADAYQAALDAANENVDLLSSQIVTLEDELASTVMKMEKSMEDKERISAEYAYLAKNYGDLKREVDANSAAAASSAVDTESVKLLEEEIKEYQSKISTLESKLDEMTTSVTEAKNEATKWKNEYDKVQSEMSTTLSDMESSRDDLQRQVNEMSSQMETEKRTIQQVAQSSIDELTVQYDATLSENTKVISALRASLEQIQSEKSSLEDKSNVERTEAVNDVRSKMNEEIANIKNVLASVKGEMDVKEQVIKEVMEGKEESENLMEEIRYVWFFICWEGNSLLYRGN